jgi:IS5 family transposase
VCRFRHLLEAHDLGQQLFDEVQRHLAAKGQKGLKVATGTMVDATIISAPPSSAKCRPIVPSIQILTPYRLLLTPVLQCSR